MVDFSVEFNFRRFERIICWELYGEEKNATFVWGVTWLKENKEKEENVDCLFCRVGHVDAAGKKKKEKGSPKKMGMGNVDCKKFVGLVLRMRRAKITTRKKVKQVVCRDNTLRKRERCCWEKEKRTGKVHNKKGMVLLRKLKK